MTKVAGQQSFAVQSMNSQNADIYDIHTVRVNDRFLGLLLQHVACGSSVLDQSMDDQSDFAKIVLETDTPLRGL
ncbi:hypothetical protein [Cohaesibacter gelatinilyticus]|uniref:Uncharacterized protein n=1 Tax=Cohaesibacter gelatinilyticus TaxID=372072 RepID=A0A285PMN8_9HYPH|nr:hypothetical protein [Cohaesibacter gelatinilyticus]SNZ21151.1 hypothetical protein SAMN06265368_4268 [Cohaesibacter gelatinilyticus]